MDPPPHPPPYTLDAFSVELMQPLQTVAIWQRHVVAGGVFFLADLGPGIAVTAGICITKEPKREHWRHW